MEDKIRPIIERVKSLSDSELIEMIDIRAKDYTTEAINIAKEEANNRGGIHTIKKRLADEEKRKQEEILKERKREEEAMIKKIKEDEKKIQQSKKSTQLQSNLEFTCSDCGADVSEEDKICPKCGANLTETVQSVEIEKDEEREPELLVRKRHKAIRGLIRFGNFIGWVLCLTIILLPIGLALLYLGHLSLVSIETEQNTREIAALMRENLRNKQL